MIKWIIAAEVAFWIAIFAGLFVRYVLKWKKVSIGLFLLTPLIDLALIALTTMDLKNGATANTAHALAAIYIGVSIAYGKTMIASADRRFQAWFYKKPVEKKTLVGMEKGVHEIKMWARHAVAYMIGSAMLWFMITFVGQEGTQALEGVWKAWSVILLIDGVISLSYVLFPKKAISR